MRKKRILKIAQISILAGFSIILYFFPKFSLPFFPSFLEVNFSNLPAIIGGLLLGPLEGMIIVIVRILVKLPMTSTMGVGELADLIIGLGTVLTSSLIYKHFHTKKGGIIGLTMGALAWVVIATLANWLFLLDFYISFYFGGSIQPLLGLCGMIPGINETNYMVKYLIWAIIPFNLLLSSTVTIITIIVYKKLSDLFKV